MRFHREVICGCLALFLISAFTVLADAKVTSGQLEGNWVRTSVADMSGIEFTKAGKVLVYYGGADEALGGEFAIGEDGRLSISMGGLNEFYVPGLANDQLELKRPDAGSVSRYRRLKAGETMAAAVAAQELADKKVVVDRNASIPELLKRPDLVMVVDGGNGAAPGNCAISFAPAGPTDYTGRAVFDAKVPKVEIVGGQMQGSAEHPTLAMWFGPGNAQQNKGIFLLHPVGAAPNITLTASVNFGGDFTAPANATVTLKPDAEMRKRILDHFKTEVARLETLKAPVVALLKDYAVLKGSSASSVRNESKGFTEQFTLARNPRNNTWTGQGQSVNRATGATETFPVAAVVGMVGEKPILQIASEKRLYLFSDIELGSGKLSGAWHLPQNPQEQKAELTIAQAVDAKGRDALFAASKAAVQKLEAGVIYHGLLNDQGANGQQPPNPIAVTMALGTGGALTGKVEYVLQGITVALNGKLIDTPTGPQLQIAYAGGQVNPGAWLDAKALLDSVQHETWLLSPRIDDSGGLRLEGFSIAAPGRSGVPASLQLIPYTEKDKAAISTALAGGARFKVICPRMDQLPDDIFEISGEAGGDKITAKIAKNGARLGAPEGTLFFPSEIKEQAGTDITMPVMVLKDPKRKPNYAYRFVVTPTESGLYLDGYIYSVPRTAAQPLGRWDAVQVKGQ
jgi:hypothetical protein